MSPDMKRLDHSLEIDLREWEFEPSAEMEVLLTERLRSMTTAALRERFEENPPSLSLPSGWAHGDGMGGPRPDDPLTIHVTLQLANHDDGVTYACSLEAAIDDVIELQSYEGVGGVKVEDEEGRQVCARIAARLRELADKLDAACASP
jgi:hypothetical protein